ncbi:hypothetical protein GR294_24460 [Raoultella sp. Lac2]|uniref:hypothetical protein n=1 Tax=unclassified Raoultella TaxID=2627600 RepID=UPI001352C571|nr:hypothetical protein [Raoultella sp. Lac2]MXF99270.1 hypothetical protein [Raoultella sp. Lac1]
MQEFKGTPGPWRFDEQEALSGGPVFYIAQDDNAKYTPNYSDVSQTCSGEIKHIQKANAQLIAAAPNLLEELQKLREYVINVCDVDEEDCHSEHPLMSSRAAISKALGEE